MQETCSLSMRQCWLKSLWCLCFSSQWLHFVGKSANSAVAFSWLVSRQLPRLHTTEKMSSTRSLIQLLLSLCTLLFKESTGTKIIIIKKKTCLYGNCCGGGECISAVFFLFLKYAQAWWVGKVDRQKSANYFKTFRVKVTERRRKKYLQWRGRRPRCGSAVSVSPGRGKWGPPKRPPELPRHRPPTAPGWQSASLQERHTHTHAG